MHPYKIRHYRNADTEPDPLKWIRALVVHLIYWTFCRRCGGRWSAAGSPVPLRSFMYLQEVLSNPSYQGGGLYLEWQMRRYCLQSQGHR